jgi:large subunit ribosomal protein L18
MVKTTKLRARRRDRQRVRLKKLTTDRLRLSVFRSSKNIYAQLIDDQSGVTIASASSLEEEVRKTAGGSGGKAVASAVGRLVAQRSTQKSVGRVYFDRGSYLFHGRVKALADAAREAGLEF